MPAKKAAAKKTTPSGRWKSNKATNAAVAKFEESFGKNMGVALSSGGKDDYEVVSTGSMFLDDAVGIGGYPTGYIVEIWGPEHAGKTTAAMIAVGQYQRRFPDKRAAWIDMEQTFNWEWAIKNGVDPTRLWLVTPKNAEDTADAAKQFMESGLCSIVVLDSVGGMIARIEFEKGADDATVGLVPKIVTRMVKQCSPIGRSNGTTTMVINQVRANIGSYGPDEDTGGGWALKHVTVLKLRIRRGETLKAKVGDEDVPVGHEMVINVQKNKLAPWGRTARVWLFNTVTAKYKNLIGIDVVPETFTLAKRYGLLGTKGGGWYAMPSGEEVRGEEKAVEFLRQSPGDMETLRARILATHNDEIGVSEEVENDEHGIAEMAQ